MAKDAAVTLVDTLSQDPHLVAFVDERVRSGDYGTAHEVVWAALRLLEEHEEKVRSLRDALVAGEESGKPRPFDFEDFKARKWAAPVRSDA